MPAPEFCDKNGRPLSPYALARRVAKLQRAGEEQSEALAESFGPVVAQGDQSEALARTVGLLLERQSLLEEKLSDLIDAITARMLTVA